MTIAVGAGQQTPLDSNSDFDVIAFVCKSIIAQLDTMKPAQVVAVRGGGGAVGAAGTVDVQLLVSLLDGSGNAVPQGVVHGLPYFRLQAGPWAIIADPAVGDVGFVLCADRDITKLKGAAAEGASSLISAPGTRRMCSVCDGVYVGGCLNKAPTAHVVLRPDGTFQITDSSGNVLQTSAGGFSLTGNVAVTGNFTATGEITRGFGGADQVSLGGHLHTSESAGSPTSPPTPGT